MDIEHVALPVPDELEVDSIDGDTTITLTYTTPNSERSALKAALDMIDAHHDWKDRAAYEEKYDDR